ncbi:MAG TPA: type II secretion system F family protein [Chloroflexota bacterium]|nr:type II secretion system F family protein [Chloroflexota bacterium]
MVVNLLAGLVTASAVFCLVYVLSMRTVGVGRGNIAGRLSKYSEVKAAAAEPRKSRRGRTRATDLIVATVDRAVSNQSFAENLRAAIARADIRITVGEFLILWGAAIVLGLFLGQVVFGTIVHTVIFTVAGIILPRFYLRFRSGQRLKNFNQQLPDTIVMLANSLRSGYSMLQSMEMVSREMNPPIATEFHRVIREVGIGLSPEEALNNLLRRINSVDLEIMVMAINVQREIGGNLSIILDTIAHTIRERIRIKGEIKTLTAQATYSGYVISFLPLVLAFVLYTIDHKYISFFWDNHSCGLPLMGATLFFIVVGFFVMRKITKIEV